METIVTAAPPGQSATEASTSTPAAPTPTPPASAGNWLTELELLGIIPVSRRTIHEWRQAGKLPFVRLPGSRRIIYHRPTIEATLLRHQRGGGQ